MVRPVDVFIHIPKTAGTTMLKIVESQYPKGHMLSIYRKPRERIVEEVAALGEDVEALAGHFHYGVACRAPRPIRAFAMLRDPVERIISLYYFIGRAPSHPQHEAFKRGEVTISSLLPHQGSMQARFLAGYEPTGAVEDEVLLREAKEVLVHRLAVFGITERFDESLLLFNRQLGWKVRGYAKANATKNRPSQERISQEDLSLIRENCAVDRALYDFARERFDRQVADLAADFAPKLKALRRRIRIAQAEQWIRDGVTMVGRRLRGLHD